MGDCADPAKEEEAKEEEEEHIWGAADLKTARNLPMREDAAMSALLPPNQHHISTLSALYYPICTLSPGMLAVGRAREAGRRPQCAVEKGCTALRKSLQLGLYINH